MQSRLFHVLAGFALASISCALPKEEFGFLDILNGRSLTPDNTCGIVANGNGNNYTCDANAVNGGGCCSPSGYCGGSSNQ